MNPFLDAALGFARRGLFVFPVAEAGKTPAIPTAHPDGDPLRGTCRSRDECGRWGHGFHDATTDPAIITSWWRDHPRANVGLSCGPSLFVVIDLDTAHGPRPAGKVLREQAEGQPTPPAVTDARSNLLWLARRRDADVLDLQTLTVTTPSGGRHLYFTRPAELEVTSGAGMTSGLGWLLDVRAVGGYVVVPPSRRTDGEYRTTTAGPPKPLPAWLTAALADAGRVPAMPRPRDRPASAPGVDLSATRDRRRHRYLRAAIQSELEAVIDAPAGEVNVTVNRAAFALGSLAAGAGLDTDQVADALLRAAEVASVQGKPFNAQKTEQTIRSGLSAGARTPRSLI